MMEKNEVASTVKEFINNTMIDKIEINLDDRLTEDLGLDSIGFVELGTGLEDKYKIDISDEELEEMKTVSQVVDYVLSCPVYAVE